MRRMPHQEHLPIIALHPRPSFQRSISDIWNPSEILIRVGGISVVRHPDSLEDSRPGMTEGVPSHPSFQNASAYLESLWLSSPEGFRVLDRTRLAANGVEKKLRRKIHRPGTHS